MNRTVLRTIMIIIMTITFLFGCGIGPLMSIYNRDSMICGVPCFLIGMFVISGLLVIEALILYLAEGRMNDTDGDEEGDPS